MFQQVPLFSSKGPWRAPAAGVRPLPDSERHARAFFEQLREFSMFNLVNRLRCDPSDSGYIDVKSSAFWRRHDAIGCFGGAQAPWISFRRYAFPIYFLPATDPGKTRPVHDAIPIENYAGGMGEVHGGIEVAETRNAAGHVTARNALNIPLPLQTIRPAAPGGADSDGNVILVDQQGGRVWEFWQVQVALGKFGSEAEGTKILKAGAIATYSLRGRGDGARSGPSEGGGRASGLPYLGGLLIPEDFQAGANSILSHALAVSVPRMRWYPDHRPGVDPEQFVYPASEAEETAFTVNPYGPPCGTRVRLKPKGTLVVGHQAGAAKQHKPRCPHGRGAPVPSPVDESKHLPVTQIVLRGLREFGAYFVDGGGGFSIAVEASSTATRNRLSEHAARALLKQPGSAHLTCRSHRANDPACVTPWDKVMCELRLDPHGRGERTTVRCGADPRAPEDEPSLPIQLRVLASAPSVPLSTFAYGSSWVA